MGQSFRSLLWMLLATGAIALGCSSNEPETVATSDPATPAEGIDSGGATITESGVAAFAADVVADCGTPDPQIERAADGPSFRVSEWLVVESEAGGTSITETLEGVSVALFGDDRTAPLGRLDGLREVATSSIVGNQQPESTELGLRVDKAVWNQIAENASDLVAIVMGVSGTGKANIYAVVSTSGEVEFLESCDPDVFTEAFRAVADERGTEQAYLLQILATGDETLQREISDQYRLANDREVEEIQWADLPPRMREATPESAPADVVADLEIATVFVEMSSHWADVDADVCLRQSHLGVFECARASIVREGEDHVFLVAYYDETMPIELWLVASLATAEANRQELTSDLERVPTLDEVIAADLRPDYALLATIEPELLQTLSGDAGIVLDLNPDRMLDVAEFVGADPPADITDDIYLPEQRIGDALDLHNTL